MILKSALRRNEVSGICIDYLLVSNSYLETLDYSYFYYYKNYLNWNIIYYFSVQLRTPKGIARRTCGEYQVGKTPLESFVISETTLYVQVEFSADEPLPAGTEVSLVFTSYFNGKFVKIE